MRPREAAPGSAVEARELTKPSAPSPPPAESFAIRRGEVFGLLGPNARQVTIFR
jgi:ABC-type Na+ transport system ATPase subunit NatA